eukprot:gene16807-23089_t
MEADDLESYMACRGHIDRLEVCNFKSYRGVQPIGPFKDFTAVVGPNGSGKSNLMDAISFVLGVRTTQLRGSQLRELLYSNSDGSSEEDKPLKGYVKLLFVVENEDGSTTEVAFSRIIQSSGADAEAAYASVYKVDGRTVTWEAYSKKLGSFGILVKIRNFLVFQGDIEAVAAKSPAGLTLLFEQISGSEGLKKTYAEVEESRNKAEERAQLAFAKKKSVAAEKKQKKEQKEEAEKHMQRQADLLSMKTELALFQLFHVENERQDLKQEKQKLDDQAEQVENDVQLFDSQMGNLKKKHAGHAKDRLLLEKKVKKLQAERDKKAPTMISAKEEMTRVARRLKMGEAELNELRSKAADQKKTIAKLEKDMKKYKDARKKLEAEVQAHYAQHANAELEGAGVQEEAQMGSKTAKTAAERDALTTQQQADKEALAQIQAEMAQLRARSVSLAEQALQQRARADAAKANERDAKRLHKEKQQELSKLQDENRRKNAERLTLSRRLEELEKQLSDARADRRESQRDRKLAEALASLKRLFPVGKVTQRAYNLALSVAMGRDIDAVVVDTEKTARDCIQYLKEQQIAPLTFIPLASCKVKPVSEALRSLGGSAKLAVDLVEYEPAFERAFLFVFGNTLVCDTVEEAKHLAFGGAERHKVVSKDGTQFSKQGLITGGTSSNADQRAAKWDESAVAALKKEREVLVVKVHEASDVHTLRSQEQALYSECSAQENRARFAAEEARMALESTNRLQEMLTLLKALPPRGVLGARFAAEEARMALESTNRLQGDADLSESTAAKREPDSLAYEKKIEARAAKILGLTTSINEVSDHLFADFSARMGVANIREYEEQHSAFEEASSKERAKLDQQESKVQSQLDYENGRDLKAPRVKKQQELDRDAARVEELKAVQAAHSEALGDAERDMTLVQEQSLSIKVELDKVEADMATLKKRAGLDKVEADMATLKKRAGVIGTERAKIGTEGAKISKLGR